MEVKAGHTREQRSILAENEKRALLWIASKIPQSVTPDHLTALGFIGTLAAGVAFWAASFDDRALFLVVVGLAVNWFGDSLDGTLARFRRTLRPRYGYYTDHVLDLVGTAALVIGMAFSGYMNPLIAWGVLTAYLMVMAEVFLSTHVRRVFRMSFLGLGPTELRIILSIGAVALYHKPVVNLGDLGSYRLFDIGGVTAIAGLAAALLSSAVKNIIDLYNEERLPQ